MTGRTKAVAEEYKSALGDLTFNSKPMINLLTMLAEENSEYAQSIVNVIRDRIKQVVNEQKMPALYLLDSILKNIGKEYMSIIAKNIVDVFCCVFETAPDERKRMQLFKLRNTWNQYIPNKVLYELDVRITRTDPNWPVSAPVATSGNSTTKQVIHVNPKFLKSSDSSTATTISATLAASIVAEKEASKLQTKINKQRLAEEEKRVQEQLRILQADKLKRDREQHEHVLRQQQLEREKLIAEQKRQLEVLRKQQQTMTDSQQPSTRKECEKEEPSESTDKKVKTSASKNSESKTKNSDVRNGTKSVKVSEPINSSSDMKQHTSESTTKVIPNIPPPTSAKDPRLKGEVLPNDPRVNRSKTKGKAAINVMNKIVTNLSTKKTNSEDLSHSQTRKIRPYVNPLYARSPVCIATASKLFASSSYSNLNLSVSKEHAQLSFPSPTTSANTKISQPSKSTVSSSISVSAGPNQKQKQVAPVCDVTQTHNSVIMQPSVTSRESRKPVVSSSSLNESNTKPSCMSSDSGNYQKKNSEIKVSVKDKSSDIKPVIKTKSDIKVSNQNLVSSSKPTNEKALTEANADLQQTLNLTSTVLSTMESLSSNAVTKSENTDNVVESSSSQIPPISGSFKNLSSRDVHIAAQAAAIATAMHQMQTGSGGIAPEQSAQLAAQLIELMQGAAKGSLPSSSIDSTVNTISTSVTVSSTTVATSFAKTADKKTYKENEKIKRSNAVEKGRTSSSKSEKEDLHDKSKLEVGKNEGSGGKTRSRSPHENKKESRHSRSPGETRDSDKNKSSDRNLRSNRTREREKNPVVLGEEPPSKKLKDSNEHLERGRKARARSPSRYYNRMERKIESDKRVEEKGKELVLERIRKVSEGDTAEHSKIDREMDTTNNVKTPQNFNIKNPDDGESKQKQFVSLKERLSNLHRKMEHTGTIDQDILTKIMAEVDHKAKDGVLLKDDVDELMWEIRHIRAESKHLSQKAMSHKGKNDYMESEPIPPNEHLHWRSRKDLVDLDAPLMRPKRPFDRPPRPDFHNGPRFGPFANDNFRHGFEGPRPGHDGHRFEGPIPGHDGPLRGPPPSHFICEGSPHPSHSGERNQPYNPEAHIDRPPHKMDGIHPYEPRHPFIDGPRPPPQQRPPYHQMGDGPQAHPGMMMDRPRGPNHRMDGPRPRMSHSRDGLRQPNMIDGPRPPMDMQQSHMDGGSRPGYVDGPRPPRMMHHMDGPRMRMDGPHRMDGPSHSMESPQQSWNGMYQPDIPRRSFNDSPRPPYMEGPQRPHLPLEGSHPPMNVGLSQNVDISQPYPPNQHPHNHHNWGQNNAMHQGQNFQSSHSRTWTTSNLADSLSTLSSLMSGSSGNQNTSSQPFDVTSLFGQLTAAGLLPKSSDKKTDTIELPEPPKEEAIPEVRLVLEDLRVRSKAIVGSLFRGMQCSSCGERFPSESLNQYRDHLDWHFRQNRKEKDGVRKGCRAWYYNLNDWVEQNIRLPEVSKAQSESETKDEEMEEAISQEKEAPKAVEDNSIPVGETAGDVCNVCMDPLEQYWDEDREEWRYRKAVRENNKTYHYHCFVDYVPFEEDEECTPPETPSFPQSPTLVSMDQRTSGTSEMEMDVSASNMSYDLDSTIASLTSSISMAMKPSRLTSSMMEVLKTGTDGDVEQGHVDHQMKTKDRDSVIPSNSIVNRRFAKSDTEVVNTLQDMLKVASTSENQFFGLGQRGFKVGETNLLKSEKYIDDQHVIKMLLCKLIETVTKEVSLCDTPYSLPGAGSFSITTTTARTAEYVDINTTGNFEKKKLSAENCSWTVYSPTNQINELESSNLTVRERKLSIDCDKKDMDDEGEIAYSPYIENCDSPVYPVITTSHLACLEDEFSYIPMKDDDDSNDTTNRHVADTINFLLDKVSVDSKGVFNSNTSFDSEEPCIRVGGSNINISVNDVNNVSGVDG